ncbi:hypothetical protein [Carboxylicivirga caseinilyticus]|uniref:hypothetical protein n=1 Tax=Carboxylicivirga caseinilyticus TaxID=3417572 RepID=UPI003D33C06F|nr:hypothetical protein [Marinilabiliaceae bacterium A049]
MKQALRILFIYLIVLGLAFAMVHFIPFQFNPEILNKASVENLIINETDSAEIITAFDIDTLLTDSLLLGKTTEIEKDTVITDLFLSCPTTFLTKLQNLNDRLRKVHEQNEVIRILHFGDSQIEGDRITANLREGFQMRFGGSGPGLNCILDPQRMNPSVWLDNNENWELQTIYDRKRDRNRDTYGLLGQYAFLEATNIGEFKISRSPWAEDHSKNYQSIRLFIAPHKGSVFIKGSIKDTEVINDTLNASVNLTEINWSFPQISPSLAFQVKSDSAIAVLGVALDSLSGVAVDNIALRGQSSPLLHRTDADLFKAMGEHLNIGMVILQYGTNIIPLERTNYNFYKKILSRQFDLLSEYLPDVPVLFVGIADAAKSENGETNSYSHLQALRNAQKELALQYGFAYFDLYEAMGGEGSIIKWTQSEPPLALTDFVHLSRYGGKRAADYITKALWQQMDRFDSLADSLTILSDSLQVCNN